MQCLCDFHIHSTLSGDGESDLLDQVRACRDAGVRWVCFTEHIDYATSMGDFLVDFPAYREKIEAARAAFPDMTIGMGLELGDTREDRANVIAQSNAVPLDYKLLSRHQVGGVDPYDADIFFAHRTREQAVVDYLDAIYESVQAFPDYDALSHLGYVFKFVQSAEFPPLRHCDDPDHIDAILQFLIEHGKALEVNTSRWTRFGDGMPGRDILARYRELGGELLTLGSDAHATSGVAQGFTAAVEQIRALGFRHLAAFAGRKRTMLPL
ncbi:MAG: histidinol-phosphatase HisJ family protein [Candidatus Spyradocola sp.]|jgi:histidinol-phosphatase (PHP family)